MLENIIMLHINQILFIKIIYICHHQKGGDCWNKFGSGNISLNVLMSNKFYLEQFLYTNIFYARSIYDCCTGQAQLKRSSDSDQVSLQNLRSFSASDSEDILKKHSKFRSYAFRSGSDEDSSNAFRSKNQSLQSEASEEQVDQVARQLWQAKYHQKQQSECQRRI